MVSRYGKKVAEKARVVIEMGYTFSYWFLQSL